MWFHKSFLLGFKTVTKQFFLNLFISLSKSYAAKYIKQFQIVVFYRNCFKYREKLASIRIYGMVSHDKLLEFLITELLCILLAHLLAPLRKARNH